MSGIFPTNVVISVYSDKLCCSIQNIYDLLEYMTDIRPYTHQIPRLMDVVHPVLKKKFPQLEATIEEAKNIKDKQTADEWIQIWNTRYGAELSVPRVTDV